MLRSSLARLQSASLMVLLLFIVTGPVVAEERTFDYRYDRLGRLVVASDGTTQIDYVYDAGGNLLTRTVPEPGLTSGLVAGWLALAALRRRRLSVLSGRPGSERLHHRYAWSDAACFHVETRVTPQGKMPDSW